MNEVALDTRVVRAGEREKANFLFYSPSVTFPGAEGGLTEAMASVTLGSRHTVRFLEGLASIFVIN